MKRLRMFSTLLSANLHYGFPLWWSIKTAFFYSRGPTPELRKAREDYLRIKEKRDERRLAEPSSGDDPQDR